jgi:hypothetical protein
MNDNVLEASHKHKVKKVGVMHTSHQLTGSSSPSTFSCAFLIQHNVTKYCDLKCN